MIKFKVISFYSITSRAFVPLHMAQLFLILTYGPTRLFYLCVAQIHLGKNGSMGHATPSAPTYLRHSHSPMAARRTRPQQQRCAAVDGFRRCAAPMPSTGAHHGGRFRSLGPRQVRLCALPMLVGVGMKETRTFGGRCAPYQE